ncbi:hypothetical protein BCR44DRAFT_1458061 [Catenaria anguillulae PL171]|uniref:Uncharacterized protein n=1 Tax=Catenaria anguillulae PL171 TaxID=765915 RepID=A0A1Y2I146_9FUNG|nr:hypothetical protein BCR44DRAFT_1458061 [Catenaria anguillulae PL171]
MYTIEAAGGCSRMKIGATSIAEAAAGATQAYVLAYLPPSAMNNQTPTSSAAASSTQQGPTSATPAATPSTGTFTQTAADLMRELHQLQAVVQSSSVLDFEAELNAALGKDTAAPTSANGPTSSFRRGTATNGSSHDDQYDGDDAGYEVVDDDGDLALASLNSDLETATRLLGLLDGKCDAMNARLDELLALMEEANDLGLDLDDSDTPVTVTVSGGESAASPGGIANQEEQVQEQATPPST